MAGERLKKTKRKDTLCFAAELGSKDFQHASQVPFPRGLWQSSQSGTTTG
jgi:hypothetical protein